MKTAGIIGGLDFLGCDITLKFLYENYKVKVAMASMTKKQNPIIRTGLKASENLLINHFDLKDEFLLSKFIEDCECLLHCGTPYQLQLHPATHSVYIPIISNTKNLFNAARQTPALKKIVFITSAAVFNRPEIPSVPSLNRYKKTVAGKIKPTIEKAFRHSGKIISGKLNFISGERIEILVVSPVTVNGNSLTNSKESTLAALQYILKHKLDHDKYFSILANRKKLDKMINAKDLPKFVFDYAQPQKISVQQECTD